MTLFLSAQLDFISFLYGLAFILLGGVCFAIVGVPGRSTAFAVLGLFAVAHGASEWLDLIALLVGDTPAFAVLRTVGLLGLGWLFVARGGSGVLGASIGFVLAAGAILLLGLRSAGVGRAAEGPLTDVPTARAYMTALVGACPMTTTC